MMQYHDSMSNTQHKWTIVTTYLFILHVIKEIKKLVITEKCEIYKAYTAQSDLIINGQTGHQTNTLFSFFIPT